MTDLKRVAHCGRVPTGRNVVLRRTGTTAGYAGLQSCGSVWACPVCSAKILARRAFEIGAVLSLAQAQGYRLGFATLTMRHRRGQTLDALWAAGQKGWRRAISGKAWQSDSERAGVIGWVRVWEVTIGPNGWHVHVHLVVVLEPEATPAQLDELCAGMFRRWSRGLQGAGLEAPLQRGQEWHLVGEDGGQAVAEYLSKITDGTIAGPDALGLELTHVRPGLARDGFKTLPVWSLLDELVMTGEASLFRLWREWERTSSGKRQVGWSKGLRERFNVPEVARSDEEIAAEELGTSDDDLVVLSIEGWRAMVRDPDRIWQLLDAAEVHGLAGVRALLDRLGDVPYWLP